MKELVNGWWVMAWNAETMMWTRRSWHPSIGKARQEARKHDTGKYRARLLYAPRFMVLPDQEPAPTEAARFRQEQAAQMVDRADALRRYKAMG